MENIKVNEEDMKIPTYAKIDEDIKKRAIMYITQCKLSDRKTKTLNALIEEALDYYMINHPI